MNRCRHRSFDRGIRLAFKESLCYRAHRRMCSKPEGRITSRIHSWTSGKCSQKKREPTLRGYEEVIRWVLRVRELVGRLGSGAANRPAVQHDVIRKVPAGNDKYRLSTSVSLPDSLTRLIPSDRQRWRGRCRNMFRVERSPRALLCFQAD